MPVVQFAVFTTSWAISGTGSTRVDAVIARGRRFSALAEVLRSELPAGFRALARELLNSSLPAMKELRSLRAQAYVIQAFAILSQAKVPDTSPFEHVARLAANRLIECYDRSHRSDWFWFESQMTYANAVLPHALFDASECWPEAEFYSVAESSFGFLDLATTSDGVFWPIGNRDWYAHGEEKSLYAQQPIEASTMVAAAIAGFQRSGEQKYLLIASRAYEWFRGQNCLQQSLVDEDEAPVAMDSNHPESTKTRGPSRRWPGSGLTCFGATTGDQFRG